MLLLIQLTRYTDRQAKQSILQEPSTKHRKLKEPGPERTPRIHATPRQVRSCYYSRGYDPKDRGKKFVTCAVGPWSIAVAASGCTERRLPSRLPKPYRNGLPGLKSGRGNEHLSVRATSGPWARWNQLDRPIKHSDLWPNSTRVSLFFKKKEKRKEKSSPFFISIKALKG